MSKNQFTLSTDLVIKAGTVLVPSAEGILEASSIVEEGVTAKVSIALGADAYEDYVAETPIPVEADAGNPPEIADAAAQ